MLCPLCNEKKLRKEFPSMDVCQKLHAEQYCLRCTTKYIEQNQSCPANCGNKISTKSKEYLACLEKLKWLFPKFDDDKDEVVLPMLQSSRIELKANVVMLGGENATVTFNSSMKVQDFKGKVQRKFGVDDEKQKLLYKEQELESYKSFQHKTMGDYNVQSGSTIQLVKILQTISEHIDHLIFDFSWGFPSTYSLDFLDASALLYSGQIFQEYVDFRNRSSRKAGWNAVTHSGPCQLQDDRRGSQRMNVSLTSLPSHIDKVFFTLSSWRSPSIASYKSPSLRFYDKSRPGKQLCSEEFDRAIDYQAVIMCSVCRVGGRWKVYSLGMPSSGNVMRENYCYLQRTIENIIRCGIC